MNKNPVINSITNSYIHAYFNTFDTINSKNRNCSSNISCQENYTNSLKKANVENEVMSKALKEADSFLKNHKKIYNIPWKIVSFSPTVSGEYPYPHTHGDTIFLPENWENRENDLDNIKSMTTTLIHEKIHIYQRMYPIETHLLIFNVWKYNIIDHVKNYESRNKKENNSFPSIRRNPDTNHFLYSDDENKMILPIFEEKDEKDENMKKFSKIKDTRDHPFELMAYSLTDFIQSRKIPNNEEKKWMETYL